MKNNKFDLETSYIYSVSNSTDETGLNNGSIEAEWSNFSRALVLFLVVAASRPPTLAAVEKKKVQRQSVVIWL
jgi:hypothetical protein